MIKRIIEKIATRVLRIKTPGQLVMRYPSTTIKLHASDERSKNWLFPRYARGTPHEPLPVEFLLRHAKPESNFFDIGSNLGVYSAALSTTISTGLVVSVEPDVGLAAITSENLQLNQRCQSVVLPASSWSESGRILHLRPHLKNNPSTNQIVTNSLSTPDPGTLVSISVSVDAISEALGIWPDLVKIDVEGAECDVLAGMANSLPRVRALAIEFHSDLVKSYGGNAHTQLLKLQNLGFSIDIVTNHRGSANLMSYEDAKETLGTTFMALCRR